MRTLDEKAVQELKARFRGEILFPDDKGYEASRKIWNGMFNDASRESSFSQR
ncbi:MAG: hypothetical protein QNK40_06800 [Desulfobacterales bacterium]|nr:hypothetical protein [Desulfobacterales bacterium]